MEYAPQSLFCDSQSPLLHLFCTKSYTEHQLDSVTLLGFNRANSLYNLNF